jgi:hypothetical protein
MCWGGSTGGRTGLIFLIADFVSTESTNNTMIHPREKFLDAGEESGCGKQEGSSEDEAV